MPTFQTQDGCALHYRIHGGGTTGPTLVFINGTGQTTHNWIPLARRLSSRFRVVLYDCRGQGDSGSGRCPLNLDTHARDLAALMGHLGVGRTGLVGLSHGARIAMAAAASLGRQIDGMVVMSVGLKTGARAQAVIRSWRHVLNSGGMPALAWAMVPQVFGEAFLWDHRTLLPKVVDALVQRNDPDQMADMLAAQMQYAPVNPLPTSCAFPILVVVGDEDLLVTPENARQLAEAVNGRWVCLNRVGHSIPAEASDHLLELIDDFF